MGKPNCILHLLPVTTQYPFSSQKAISQQVHWVSSPPRLSLFGLFLLLLDHQPLPFILDCFLWFIQILASPFFCTFSFVEGLPTKPCPLIHFHLLFIHCNLGFFSTTTQKLLLSKSKVISFLPDPHFFLITVDLTEVFNSQLFLPFVSAFMTLRGSSFHYNPLTPPCLVSSAHFSPLLYFFLPSLKLWHSLNPSCFTLTFFLCLLFLFNLVALNREWFFSQGILINYWGYFWFSRVGGYYWPLEGRRWRCC